MKAIYGVAKAGTHERENESESGTKGERLKESKREQQRERDESDETVLGCADTGCSFGKPLLLDKSFTFFIIGCPALDYWVISVPLFDGEALQTQACLGPAVAEAH